MSNFLDWREHTGSDPEKFFKTTLWQGSHLMLGLNCLEPGQTQKLHAHDDADKIYFVLEGAGDFTIGDDTRQAHEGTLVVAPASIPHAVSNQGSQRLSLLVAIAPPPHSK